MSNGPHKWTSDEYEGVLGAVSSWQLELVEPEGFAMANFLAEYKETQTRIWLEATDWRAATVLVFTTFV